MSVRAYHVKEIIREDEELFNLWHDKLLMQLLEGYLHLDEDGSGIVELSCEEIKDAKKRVLDSGITSKKDEIKYTKEVLQKMLKIAKDNGGYIMLECF